MYDWVIRFRNDRMGFVKRIELNAETSMAAIAAGLETLVGRGYNIEEFDVVELKRSGDGR